jgi:hypothetical protein
LTAKKSVESSNIATYTNREERAGRREMKEDIVVVDDRSNTLT